MVEGPTLVTTGEAIGVSPSSSESTESAWPSTLKMEVLLIDVSQSSNFSFSSSDYSGFKSRFLNRLFSIS